ncbi:unnamed protein product [Coffea canephora]|uniref:Uncharacterized protein n=1 Tax=Coffea canephora TaxID=49390 RepID=A0A068UUE1_COFCA|nr:unnamed protein product [Coffea canephora]
MKLVLSSNGTDAETCERVLGFWGLGRMEDDFFLFFFL